jgi:hypothetical protein
MKTYHSNHTASALTIASLLFATILAPSQAADPTAESHRAVITKSGSTEPSIEDGRLVVRRPPNLGNNVIVDLYIDGVAALPIVYGQTYAGLLKPGRHVLSVVASPGAIWPTQSKTVLDVQKGQTYSFNAVDDGSGQLVLKGS